jgi:hypothetical protein
MWCQTYVGITQAVKELKSGGPCAERVTYKVKFLCFEHPCYNSFSNHCNQLLDYFAALAFSESSR